jgi:hypothetical protein
MILLFCVIFLGCDFDFDYFILGFNLFLIYLFEFVVHCAVFVMIS